MKKKKEKYMATFKDERHKILAKIYFGSSSITVFIALSSQFSGFQIFFFDRFVLSKKSCLASFQSKRAFMVFF